MTQNLPPVFDACQRAQTAHSLGPKHLQWNVAVPAQKELGSKTTITPHTQLWFRVQSSLAFQQPSTVLVESFSMVRGHHDTPREGLKSRATSRRGCPAMSNSSQGQIEDDRAKYESSSVRVLRKLELSTVGFFEFLFSDRWPEERCLLRVLPGKLLSNMLHGLVMLGRYHEIISYSTMVTTRKPSIQPCIRSQTSAKTDHKKPALDATREEITETDPSKARKVLVMLEYFCPLEQPLGADTVSRFHLFPGEEGSTTSEGLFPVSQRLSVYKRESGFPPGIPSSTQTKTQQPPPPPPPPPELQCNDGETNLGSSPLAKPSSTESTTQPQDVTSTNGKATPLSGSSAGKATGSNKRNSYQSSRATSFPESFHSAMKGPSSNRPPGLHVSCSMEDEDVCADDNISILVNDRSELSRAFLLMEDGGEEEEEIHLSSTQQLRHEGARCNMRGHTRPAEHSDCRGADHVLREALTVQRQRDQLDFPPVHVWPPFSSAEKTGFRWSDRWQDDFFLGPKFDTDKSDMVGSEPLLERNPTEDEQLSKHAAAFSKQRAQIASSEAAKLEREERLKHDKQKLSCGKSKPNARKKSTVSDSDEEEVQESARIQYPVDRERVDEIKRDIRVMSSEFFVDKLEIPQKNRVHGSNDLPHIPISMPPNTETNETKKLGPKQVTAKCLSDKEMNPPPKSHEETKSGKKGDKSKKSTTRDTSVNPKPRRRSSPLSDKTYTPVRKWDRCPDFLQFYYYLQGKKDDEIQALVKERKCPSRPILHDVSADKQTQNESPDTKTTGEIQKCVVASAKETQHDSPAIKTRKTSKKCAVSFQIIKDKEEAVQEKGNKTAIQISISISKDKKEAVQEKGDEMALHISKDKKEPVQEKSKKKAIQISITNTITISKGNKEEVQEKCNVKAFQISKDKKEAVPEKGDEKALQISKDKKEAVQEKGKEKVVSEQSQSNTLTSDNSTSSVKSSSTVQSRKNGPGKTSSKKTQRSIERKHFQSHDISCSGYLSFEEEVKARDAGLVISDIDPWHIYMPASNLSEDSHDRVDTGNALLKHRQKLHRLLEGTGLILQLNKSRVSSLVRQVPRESSVRERKVPPAAQEVTQMKEKQRPETEIGASTSDSSTRTEGLQSPSHRSNGDTIPDTITDKELWQLMKVKEVFNVVKLKSTYSFEKMFSTQLHINAVSRSLAKYQHPETKKKVRTASKLSSPGGSKKKGSPFKKQESLAKEKVEPQESEEDAPIVEDYRDAGERDLITTEFYHQLLLALKSFVVRKERATSVTPMQSRVSLTFSRPPSASSDPAVQMNSTARVAAELQDAACSRQLVTALCRTLPALHSPDANSM